MPTNPVLTLRTGFELELLAPAGSSRQVLADELARRCGGSVRRVWHSDSEPSLVPGMGRFLHATQGFTVLAADSVELCTLVDDITIVADLDVRAPAPPGWHRLLTDDARLLRLLTLHADPSAPVEQALEPVARIFGTPVEQVGPAWRLSDSAGATIALAARASGQRERPCEIVTPPLPQDHLAVLQSLLAPARELGFTVPVEAAVHLHVDAAPFREVTAFGNVVRLFSWWREALWELLGTNPRCQRLSPLPPALLDLLDRPWESWGLLAAEARTCGLTKFADVNLVKVVALDPDRHTLEIRVLPGALDGADVVRGAAVVESLLRRCLDPRPLPRPVTGTAAELTDLL
jgi:hypothetical protein